MAVGRTSSETDAPPIVSNLLPHAIGTSTSAETAAPTSTSALEDEVVVDMVSAPTDGTVTGSDGQLNGESTVATGGGEMLGNARPVGPMGNTLNVGVNPAGPTTVVGTGGTALTLVPSSAGGDALGMLDLRRQTLIPEVAIAPSNGVSVGGGSGNGVGTTGTAEGTEVGSTPSTAKRKRKQYANDEERRKARILKNRRTAEESRQRRLKRLRELEEIARNAEVREKEQNDTIRELRATVASQAAHIAELERELHAHRDLDIDQPQRNLDIKRLKLRK